jgi:NhaP-type Na+/H+ or K+/H+ antiporter
VDAHLTGNPALIVALALAVGMVAQALARHLRIPGIVLLLASGVLLGPDGMGIIRPEVLGESLHILIGFSVAVILFEGGLNLEWRRVRREAVPIRRLLSLGVVITAVGAALAARLFLGWDGRLAVMFGTLVIVTGPTVVTPLLRRIRVQRELETILETEGVVVDAIGAIVAIVTLEVVLSPGGTSRILGLVGLPSRLVFGILFGLVGGAILALLLRLRRAVPEGLENILTLSLALAIYQLSNAVMAETGIVSVIVAGMVVGNANTPVQRELREFKEQLTVLLIGMLFVLLAAAVRLHEIAALGVRGLSVVLILMFIVRPATVLACTWGAGMGWRPKAFLAWVAPRGIVAAAVSSLFDDRLTAAGMSGGAELRAMVFLVIAATVIFQGATAEFVARLLRVRRPSGQGFAILGANPLGRILGRVLATGGEKVVFIDSSAEVYQEAQEERLRVVYGNALEERVLMTAGVESRKAVLSLLGNGAVSLLFARKSREEYGTPRACVALDSVRCSITPAMVHQAGASVLFAEPVDLELWSVRLRRGLATVQQWRREEMDEVASEVEKGWSLPANRPNSLLPLAMQRGEGMVPLDDETRVKTGDVVFWLVFGERADELQEWLTSQGWYSLAEEEENAAAERARLNTPATS